MKVARAVPGRATRIAVPLLALLLAVTHAAQSDLAAEGLNFLHVEELSGVSKWQLLPYLWQETTLNVTCPGIKEFNVYVAKDMAALLRKYELQDRVWCGWLGGPQRGSCITQISPFGPTFVAVGRPAKGAAWRGAGRACVLQSASRANWRLLAQGVAGAALFLNAEAMSGSTFFRLTTGTLVFMAASSLVVLFLLLRSVNNKKYVTAMFAAFGGGLVSFSRWLFGSWIPSTAQLMHSKLVWGYLVASALTGLAITYYFDRPEDVKLSNIIKVGMQLLGLAAVALSTTLPEASMALAAALVAWQAASTMRTWWPRAKPAYDTGRRGVSAAVRSGSQLLARLSPRKGVESERGGWQTPPPHSAEHIAAQAESYVDRAPAPISPLVQKGLILNEDTGRTIQVGKATYQKLVAAGYMVDEQRGVITPPPAGSTAVGGVRRRSSLAPS